MNIKKIMFSALIAASFFYSCTNKFDPSGIVVPPDGGGNIGDTLYVQQFPIWEGFNNPQDIIVGKDNFIYVADTDNDRIVMMDVSGRIVGVKPVKHPVAIDQDYRMNLVICAQLDTLGSTFSAVYKLDLVSVNHNIGSGVLKKLLPATSFDLLRPDREYTSVCVFFDNSFYVSRKGPVNSNPIDPDNSILVFENKKLDSGERVDTLLGRLPSFEPEGTGLRSANRISSLTAFRQQNKEIIVTLHINSFKSQWLEFVQTPDFEGYQSKLPVGTDFLTPERFSKPEGAAIDRANNIFIADSEKDSVFKFNSFGDELQSFGGPKLFNSPHAVAFFDKTIYVADTGNNRILRFILSTELN